MWKCIAIALRINKNKYVTALPIYLAVIGCQSGLDSDSSIFLCLSQIVLELLFCSGLLIRLMKNPMNNQLTFNQMNNKSF